MTAMLLSILLSGGDFDTRLVLKLSEMLKVKAPEVILIERVEEKELLEELKKSIVASCMNGRPDLFVYCNQAASVQNTFVHGVWLKDKPEKLRIKLYKRAGVDVLIHEFCHWYLHYQTEPNGLINAHEVLKPLATALLVSDELIKWLEKEGR